MGCPVRLSALITKVFVRPKRGWKIQGRGGNRGVWCVRVQKGVPKDET